MKGNNLEKKYIQKAHKWAKVLGVFPGICAIFLSGSLARGDGNEHSDIDFFVITRKGQIWTARFWVFFVLKFFGQLAKPENHPGKICPNHFISENCLEIREQDAYAAKLFSKNFPLYDPMNIFPQFIHKNEKWIAEFGCEFGEKQKMCKTQNSNKKLNFFEKKIEEICRKIQIWKIKQNSDFQKKGACIILENKELRFHPNPKNRLR